MDLRNVNFFNKTTSGVQIVFDKNIVNSSDSQREAVYQKVLPFTPEIFKTGQDKLN
jgi:hypothetical protein